MDRNISMGGLIMTIKELYEICERFDCLDANIRVMGFDDTGKAILDCPLYDGDILCYDDEVIIHV